MTGMEYRVNDLQNSNYHIEQTRRIFQATVENGIKFAILGTTCIIAASIGLLILDHFFGNKNNT